MIRPDVQTVAAGAPRRAFPLWAAALIPVVLVAGLVAWIVRSGPGEALTGYGYPPVERLVIERAELTDNLIRLSVMNDGPDAVTVAQVQVDDAYWTFSATNGQQLAHLGRTVLEIPYPWVHGESHTVRVVTSTGVTFDHTIGVAVPTPRPDGRSLMLFTLIGLYVGVLPVAIGLLWYPLVSRLGRRGLDFVLALTIGLLAFLLVDATHEAGEVISELPGSYQGAALLVFGAFGCYVAIEWFGRWLSARRAAEADRAWVVALLIAIGIGLHNFSEGLAIGAAFSLGEAALGSLLIIGFTLHNTTEGLAIVAPLARERVSWRKLIGLGLIAGAPAVLGAWIGAAAFNASAAAFLFGFGAGAIVQVIATLVPSVRDDDGRVLHPGAVTGILAGMALMFATGLLVTA
jgi:zinc transporter ZupT